MSPAASFDLANGMRFIVAEDHAAPVAAVGMWARAGACDEPPDRRGIAHFLEHMMFRGSQHVSPEEHSRRIERLGGDANGWTDADVTVYHETIPAGAVAEAFRLEADRFARPALNPQLVAVERKVVLEELHAWVNQPMAKAMRLILQAVAEGHPYAIDPLGREEDLAAAGQEDLKAFYQKCYRPGRVFAVVVGDVTVQQIRDLAEEHFGSWSPRAAPGPADSAPPFLSRAGELSARLPFQVPVVARVHRLPPSRQIDRPALLLLERLLTGGRSSLVREALVEKSGLCIEAGAITRAGVRGGVLAVFGAFLPPGRHARRRRILREICDRIVQAGPEPQRLARCIKRLRHTRAAQQYHPPERMRLLGWAELLTGSYQSYLCELEELGEVTPDRVRDLAEGLFAPDNTLELDVVPERMAWWMWPVGILSKAWKR